MKLKSTLRHFLALAGSSLLAVSSASATIVNWDGDTSTTWATAGNWDTAPANSLTADIANFNLATYDGVTVFAPTVGTATSINGITIGASNGTMTLTNTAALSIGASGISIASGAGAFTISGSTTLGAAQSWTNNSANLFTFGAVTAGANLLTIGGSGNTTASGIISGTNGALTKEGAGLLTLNAANTYTGATTVNGGELRWGVANALNAGALNINNGGTVNIQTFSDTVGTITIANGGGITGTTGVLTTGSFISNDGGTISGFSSGAGLRLGGGITYNSTGPGSTTLQIDRVFVPDLSPTFNIADGDAAIDFEITGTLSGGGNNISRTITKTGVGVMQFSGSEANTTGINQMPLQIWDGTVIFNKSAEVNALPTGNITIGDGTGSAGSAMLQYRTSNNQLGANSITINSDGLFDLNGKSESLGGVTVNSTGQLQLNNGQLTVTSLTLNPSAGNTTTVSLGGTGILTLGGDVTFNAAGTGRAQITGSDLSLGAANRIFNVGLGTGADYDLLVGAGISGARSLTKNGLGRLVLTGSNSYTLGTTVNAGTLQIGDGTTVGTMTSTGALTMGGGTFGVLAPASGGSSQTIASLQTTASTGSIIRLTPGASGNTTLTITSATLPTGAGASVNFDYTAGTTVGGTVGNNYVVWNPSLTGGIIGGAYTVTDSGGTGFATTSGGNVVRLTDTNTDGLPDSTGSATGSYFVASGYSTNVTTTPGSLVLALSGAVDAHNVTVDTTGLASGANLALDTNLLTLGAGMVFNGPNPYEISGSGAGGLKAASAGGTIYLNNANTNTVTISAPIVNNTASRLTIDGPGTTILSGANTYTGATVVNGGTVRFSGTMGASAITINNDAVAQLGTATGLNSGNSVTFGAGATGSLELLGNNLTIGALSSNATTLGTPVITNNSVANATLTIDSASASSLGGVIQDGTGGGTLTLAKSGSGTLTLSGTNTYSGGTVINGGTLQYNSDAALGASGSRNITFGGTGSLTWGFDGSSLGILTVNPGAVGTLGSLNNLTFATTTGSGTIRAVGGQNKFVNLGDASTFTGNVALAYNANNNSGANTPHIRFSGLNDAVGSSIQFYRQGGGTDSGQVGQIGLAGDVGSLTFDNRQIQLLAKTGGTGQSMASVYLLNNNGTAANNWVINTNLLNQYDRDVNLGLGGTNTGGNAFNGVIGNSTFGGPFTSGTGVLSLRKEDAGRWILGGANTYTGATTVTGGTLQVSTLADGGNNSSLGASTNVAGNLILNGGTLRYTGAAVDTDRLFSLQVSSTIDASGTGALNFENTGAMGFNGGTAAKTLTLTGTNTGNNTIAAVIGDNTGATAITKTGIGTWVLSGANTFTGATTATGGGTLVLNYGTNSTKLSDTTALTLGGTTGGSNLILRGGSHSEIVGSLTLTTGHSTISRDNSSTAVINLNTITRTQSAGGTLAIAEDNIATTDWINKNGILGGGITVGSHWAKNSTGGADGLIVALSSGDYTTMPTTGGTATVNYQLTGGAELTGNVTGNSFRILGNGDDQVLDIKTFTFKPSPLTGAGTGFSGDSAAGGILYAGGGNGNYTITGSTGTIGAQNNGQELVIHTYTGTLTVDAIVANGVAVLTKSGAGALVLTRDNTYTGITRVNQGTLLVDGSTASTTNATIVFANATLGGKGTIGGNVTVQSGGGLKFDLTTPAGSHDALDLAATRTLTFSGESVLTITSSGGSPAVGTYTLMTAPGGISGVAPATLNLPVGWVATTSIVGNDLVLNVTSVGSGGPGPLDHFDISAISSPQTVGTPITGITLTAQDAANQTVTSFTGTVNFSGTGGFSGTSASFVAGVLNSVSVTPTNAGSNLTFIVTDGVSGKTGLATITTIQSQYAAWSGGAAFDSDTNGDGVKNGLAFLLGAANKDVSALGLLPTVSQSGGNLVMTFKCRKDAYRGSALLNVEHSSNLGISDAWLGAPVTDAGSPLNNVSFSVSSFSTELNSVTATISSSEAASGKLFGRLKGTNP